MMKAPAMKKPDGPATEVVEGILELDEKGAGVLRDPKRNFARAGNDPRLLPPAIRKFQLRGGEPLRVQLGRERPRQAQEILDIHGAPASDWESPTPLVDTVAIDPQEPLRFETDGGPLSMRVVQMFTPIGRGQRGLIVAPPRTGKTVLLQQIAHGLAENHPDLHLIVLLIDERPEEVTEMRRNVRGDVFASSNDHQAEAHVRLARIVIEHARRRVEVGEHIIILLDSITRLARAFNHTVGSSGRTMTGGLDIRALQEPKQIFGSARNVEGGGSLTILATALVDTGSRADGFIFEEFKGTGNMELALHREMANLRIWPAIDIDASGTRKEEKLLSETTLRKVSMIRRQLNGVPPPKAMTTLLERMRPHATLQAFLDSLAS